MIIKYKWIWVLCSSVMVFSCTEDTPAALAIRNDFRLMYEKIMNDNRPVCYYEAVMLQNGLSDVKKIIPDIIVDLKYSGEENFMGFDMYDCLDKAYLLPHVAEKLLISQNYLKELHPGYSLIIYDAARPIQAQKLMWDSLEMPIEEKILYLSNPRFGSLHNYGAAVDVSIVDDNGELLDMGTPFDFIGEESQPALEWKMLSEGRITQEQINNRVLLRNVMRKGGFWGIPGEWWHYNAMTRQYAAEHFRLLQ